MTNQIVIVSGQLSSLYSLWDIYERFTLGG